MAAGLSLGVLERVQRWVVLIVRAFGGWDRFPSYNLARAGNWYDFGFVVGAGSPLPGFFGRGAAAMSARSLHD